MSAPSHDNLANEPDKFSAPMLIQLACVAAIVIGAVTFGLAWVVGLAKDVGPQLAFGGWSIAAWYAVGFPIFGMFLLTINHLSAGGWHVTMKRVPEAMTQYFPVGLLTIAAVFLSFLFTTEGHQLYEWAHFHDHGDLHSELIEGKSPWLNIPFFIIRTAVYFSIWIFFAWALVRASRKQDIDGDVKHTFRARYLSAPFGILFGLSVTFASVDYIKSVEPTWFSTMFGVYHFAGIVESGFAMLILLLLVVQRAGYLRGVVNENHFHNLGIWLLASATFWAYIWFCQFMLIWYSNIPEETAHYFARMNTPWFWVTFVLNPLLNWALVFLILLPRPNKRNKKLLGIAACIALLGRWIDLWQFTTPVTHLNKAGMPEVVWLPQETFWLIGMAVGTVGLFVLVTLKVLERAPLLARKDPYFEESLHHHL